MKTTITFINNIHKRQQGVILPITLIALLVLMIASVALIRSTETNLLIAGNLGFKRDLINQAERTAPTIKTLFETGALQDQALRLDDALDQNYLASMQASNQSGIPNTLLDVAGFDSQYSSNNIVDTDAQVTIRYLIDRMCLSTGAVTVTKCVTSASGSDTGGDAMNLSGSGKATGNDLPVYRLSIRITGPRNTEAFLQSTFSQ